MEELKSTCQDMRKEIGQRVMEVKVLKEDMEEKNRQISKQKQEVYESNEEVERFKVGSLIFDIDDIYWLMLIVFVIVTAFPTVAF